MVRLLCAIATMCGVAAASPVLADGGPAAGEKVFKKCMSCHMIGDGAQHKTGPELNNLFGRTAGGVGGYSYSPAMKSAGEGGLVWSEETLKTYLADPRGVVPDTKMSFSGLRKEQQIIDILVYLKSFSE